MGGVDPRTQVPEKAEKNLRFGLIELLQMDVGQEIGFHEVLITCSKKLWKGSAECVGDLPSLPAFFPCIQQGEEIK
jgi:hypothetical protein